MVNGDLDAKANEYRLNSIADTSKTSRRKHWKDYNATCDRFGWEPLPCGVKQACRYVAFLAERLKFSSICTYYQSVIFYHVCAGLEPVRMSNPVLSATLKGIERLKGECSKGKDPIFPHHLLAVREVINWADELELLVFVACLFMFRTLLRVSHVVCSAHTLRVSDVVFDEGCCYVKVKSSKTTSNASTLIPGNLSRNPKVCATRAVSFMLGKFKTKDGSYLFSSPRYPFLTYSVFAKKLKELFRRAKLSGDFASHSLRRGGATHMSMLDCPISQIKYRGQWKSDCVYRYIVPPVSKLTKADKFVANNS